MSCKLFKRSLLFVAFNLALSGVALANESKLDKGMGFYESKSEGWFWYKDEKDKPKEEIEKEPEPKIAVTPDESKNETDEMKPMSAAWLRVNMPKYLEKAWDNPTLENLKVYTTLHKYYLDRSEEFGFAYQQAVIGDPYLDTNATRPINTNAANFLDDKVSLGTKKALDNLAKKTSLVFFFNGNCTTCESQVRILMGFAKNHNFTVLPVSTDGKPLKSYKFDSILVDKGQSAIFDVKAVPSVYLMDIEGKHARLSQGLLSLSDFQSNAILIGKREKWVSDEDYLGTRPILTDQFNLSNKINLKDFEGLAKDENGFVDGKELLDLIQQKINGLEQGAKNAK